MNSRLNAAGSDLSGIEHVACALDIGFMCAERHLKEKEQEEEGAVSRNRATVAHVANTE